MKPMKAARIEELSMSELQAEDGTYSKLVVLCSAAGYYIGRTFKGDDEFEEPGSRESGYFPTEQEATKALMEGFDWRNVAENCHLYETHERLEAANATPKETL
jgi:hypothetical protein